ERAHVSDASRAGGIPVRWTDDHPDAVIDIAGAGLSQPLYAGVLGRDVDLEGSKILRNPLPHVLDGGPLRAVEGRRIPIEVKGSRDNVRIVGEVAVPDSSGSHVSIKIEVYGLGRSGTAVKQEGLVVGEWSFLHCARLLSAGSA